MRLKQVELVSFRSYKNAKFQFGAGLTLVSGANGTGKTNLLESLYLLATTRSWRARDRQLVRHGADGYVLRATTDQAQINISYTQTDRQKIVRLNGRRLQPSRYLGKLGVVLFEPQALMLLLGPPLSRRRWLNQLLSQTDKKYLKTLQNYHHTLAQRNRLLASRASSLDDQIFAWDMALAEQANYLVARRHELISFVDTNLADKYKLLASKPINLTVAYSNTASAHDYGSQLLSHLSERLGLDRERGFTSVGPHRDELEFRVDGKPSIYIVSRGELRSILLALKLVEQAWLTQATKESPLLLFDDVFSELDRQRQHRLIDSLASSQVVLTATNAYRLNQFLPARHMSIKL